jgi:hypothetical protein
VWLNSPTDKVVAHIRDLATGGLAGRAYWLSGQSGTGKTTIARLLAAEVASPWDIEETDAGALTTTTLRDLEHVLTLRGLGEPGGRPRSLASLALAGTERSKSCNALPRFQFARGVRHNLLPQSTRPRFSRENEGLVGLVMRRTKDRDPFQLKTGDWPPPSPLGVWLKSTIPPKWPC